jgi:DNA modification methylase
MRTKDLAPNPKNPRTVTEAKLEQLKKALLEFGDLSGIVYNRTTKQLVGGHQRLKSFDADAPITITRKFNKATRTGTVAEGYVELRGERFSYREVSWDKHREMAANLAANKGAGEWDLPQVGEWLKELGSFDVDFDVSLTMFDEEELKDFGMIIVSEHTRVGATGVDEDEVPEKPPARTRLGSVYQLGEHRLICADSTKAEIIRTFMKGDEASMVWTDPPYNVDYVGKTKNALKIQNDKMDDASFREFLKKAFVAMVEVTRPGGAVYVSHADSEGYNFRGAMRDAGWLVKQCLIWKKQSLVMGRQDFHWIHEPILYGWKPGNAHYWYNDRKQTTVLEFARPSKSPDHPTTKPVDLIEYCIGNNSKPGEIVFDGFGGSGSTLIACEKLGRKARLVELDPSYCDVIVERWEKYTGQKAMLLNPVKMPAVTKLRKKPAKQEASRNVQV